MKTIRTSLNERLFAYLCLLMLSAFYMPAHAFETQIYAVSLKLLEQRKNDTEGFISKYQLMIPEGVRLDQKIEVFYTLTPWKYSSLSPEEGEPEFYSKPFIFEDGKWVLEIVSGRTEKIGLLVKAVIEGRSFYAQTLSYAFGKSGQRDSEAVRIAKRVNWPVLTIVSAGKSYRAQTGDRLIASLQSDIPLARLSVLDNQEHLFLDRLSDGSYQYIPPHRDSLSKKGFSVWEDLVFIADLGEQGIVSCYLPLYRSLNGYSSLPWGLFILFSSAFIFLLLVLYANKKFQQRFSGKSLNSGKLS